VVTETLAVAALEEHADRLIELPNVVAVGVTQALGSDSDDMAVAVYVSSRSPPGGTGESSDIPQVLMINGQSVPVRVVEIGEITLQSGERGDVSGD